MRTRGRSRKSVLSELRKIQQQEAKYEDGRILCSMCSKPHPVATAAHKMFLDANLGDSGLFPGTRRLEEKVVDELASLLNGKNSVGFIVSGGTEANLLALLAARNRSDISEPEVVLPESAHFSFDKICHLLGLKPVHALLDSSYRVDPNSVKRCLSKNTVAVVGTAGTAELGAVDPVRKLSALAVEHGLYLHVDAAFGGLIIPFMEESGDLEFDFRLEGVRSVTIDPHKMGLSTIPAGGIMFRDRTLLNYIKTSTPYLNDKLQYTLVGTRSGASAAASWAVFELLGREGYTRIVHRCMALARYLSKSVESIGLKLVSKPTLNIVAFRSSNSSLLAGALRKRGWFVSYVPRLDCIRLVVMPHLRKKHLTAFLSDLEETLHVAEAQSNAQGLGRQKL